MLLLYSVIFSCVGKDAFRDTQRNKKSCYFWGTEGKYGKNKNVCVPVETAEELQFGFPTSRNK